jgi:hypothetical protein
MKPRHAAVLALVGWALMIPDEIDYPTHSPAMMDNFGNDWDVIFRYKNAEECANALAFLLSHKEGLATYAARTKESTDGVEETLKIGGFCVRDDDPRLKEK